MKKYLAQAAFQSSYSDVKYSMYIGRWQPWHSGHRWLIDQRLGEFNDSIHFIEGYDLPREFIFETTELDTGRRRYDV
jgi:nicotinamide mononucleotide adenylyltransferase